MQKAQGGVWGVYGFWRRRRGMVGLVAPFGLLPSGMVIGTLLPPGCFTPIPSPPPPPPHLFPIKARAKPGPAGPPLHQAFTA